MYLDYSIDIGRGIDCSSLKGAAQFSPVLEIESKLLEIGVKVLGIRVKLLGIRVKLLGTRVHFPPKREV